MLFNKWQEALSYHDASRTFAKNNFVCAKHFQESDITSTWVAINEKTKEVAMTVQLKKPRLNVGAIPSIFPTFTQPPVPVHEKERPVDTSRSHSNIKMEISDQQDDDPYVEYSDQNSSDEISSLIQDSVSVEIIEDNGRLSILDNSCETSSDVKDRVLDVTIEDIEELSMRNGSNGTNSSLQDQYEQDVSLIGKIKDNSMDTFMLIWYGYYIELPSSSWTLHLVKHNGVPSLIVLNNIGAYSDEPVHLKQGVYLTLVTCFDCNFDVMMFTWEIQRNPKAKSCLT